ncbi:unnamed protein product [Lymnaea stagnalis]|uniref:Uncharacterized protein n=1 Tax=Lymnaea stagnalis TaxID=6523 RepID=A0AAV2ILW1_LYMST
MKQGKIFEKRRKRKKKFEDPLLGRGVSEEIRRPSQHQKLPAHVPTTEDYKAVWLVIACTMSLGAGLLTGGVILIVRGQHNNITDFLVLGCCGVVTGLCFTVVAVVRMYKSIRTTPSMRVHREHRGVLSARQHLADRAAKVKLLNEQIPECRGMKKNNQQAIDDDQQKLLEGSKQKKSSDRSPSKVVGQFPAKVVHFFDLPNDSQNEKVIFKKITQTRNEFVPLVDLSTRHTSSQKIRHVNKSLDTRCNGDNNAAGMNMKLKAKTRSTPAAMLIDDRNNETSSASERRLDLVERRPDLVERRPDLVEQRPDLVVPRHRSELKIVLNNNKEHQAKHGIVAIKKNSQPLTVHTLTCFNKKTGDSDMSIAQPSSRHLITTVVDITPFNPGHTLTTDHLSPSNPGSRLIALDITPHNPGNTTTAVAEIVPQTDDLSLPDLPIDHNLFYHFCDSGKSSIDSSSIFQSFDEDDVKEDNIFSHYRLISWDQPPHSLNGKRGHTGANGCRSYSRSDSFTYENSQQTIKKQVWSKRGSGVAVSKQFIRNPGFYVMDDQIEVLGE